MYRTFSLYWTNHLTDCGGKQGPQAGPGIHTHDSPRIGFPPRGGKEWTVLGLMTLKDLPAYPAGAAPLIQGA